MPDRADRLSSRRKGRSEDQPAEQDQQGESGEKEKPEQPAEPEQQAEQKQEQEASQSIKDQYKGKYMYLPEALGNEFDLVGQELDTQRQRRTGKEVEKIRHFEPLVVALGLDAIENMDDDELEEHLAEFDP